MAGDIDQFLQRTAVEPSHPVDAAQIVARGRRRRRRRQGLVGGSALALLAVGVLVAVLSFERSEVQFDPVAPPSDGVDGDEPAPPSERVGGEDWEVLAVGGTSVAGSGPGRLVANQRELDEAWTSFLVDGPPPGLPSGQGALVGSVAGDCDHASHVLGIERLPADSAAGTTGELAAMHVDAECAFIDRFGSASPGPRTVYVIGVPVDWIDSLVGFEAVTASVADLEWQLLTIETGVAENAIGVGGDQRMLDWAWSAWELDGEAPTVPDGWSAFATRVPGTCTEPAQLRGVEAIGYIFTTEDGFGTVGLAAQFDPSCAEREAGPDQPRSLYVILVPADVADTLHGPWPYITCDGADDVGACAGSDRELIHAQW